MVTLPEPLRLSKRRLKRRRRRIRGISMLPSLVTLGNLLCGFAAIHFAARSDFAIHSAALAKLLPTNLALACYLVFAAMICDTLDGRLARFARTTSDFGGQLDSLADIVSFGAAPAFIAIRLMTDVLASYASEGSWLVSPAADSLFGRACWLTAAVYLGCAALRLARFNVENVPDESAHLTFRGLPVPGAAGALISMVLLNEEVIPSISPDLGGVYNVLIKAMPLVLVGLGVLMVSRLPYVHIINRYLRGNKPFWMLVVTMMSLMALLIWPQLVLAVGLCGYAISGPVAWSYRQIFAGKTPLASQVDTDNGGDDTGLED